MAQPCLSRFRKIISGRAQFHKRLYQIPYSALTTAADGTLVAATDIRWDKCGDGGGIDTVVSRSTDDGENWSYTVANYLGDNGNKFNYYSSAFIDAALVTKGDAIYMACDLYPAAIGLNSALMRQRPEAPDMMRMEICSEQQLQKT